MIMKNSCLYFRESNKRRKDQFRLTIRICEENQKKYFIKTADNEEALNFLHLMIKREHLAQDFFGGLAEVIVGTLKNDSIYYPYLSYPTMDNVITEIMKTGDSDFGLSMINEYISLLRALPSIQCVPHDFVNEFNIPAKQLSVPVRCLARGPIDLIPPNILIGDHIWHVVDNEWFYNFPIPVEWVIYRGIVSLIGNLQQHIQSKVSEKHPVVLFSGYGKNRSYIPVVWLQFIETLKIPIQNLSYWNYLFQSKVLLNQKKGHLRLEKKPIIISSLKCPFHEIVFSAIWHYIIKIS